MYLVSYWQEVFDVSTGLWNFSPNSPSQKKVFDDPFDDKLLHKLQERDQLAELSFYPECDEDNCECGVSSHIFDANVLNNNFIDK